MPWQRRPGPGGCWWSPDAGLVLATAVGMLRLLVAVSEKVEAVAGRVRERAPGDRQALLLATVSGLGYYAALLVLAGIGDVSCFPTARRLWSYAGLVPSTYASGGVVTHGAITRRGFSFLRWALVETVMHVLGRPGPLQEFYRRLLVGKGAQKARVARKLSKAVFWILSMSRFYRKLGPCLAPQGQASSEAYVAGG
jgi:transposase